VCAFPRVIGQKHVGVGGVTMCAFCFLRSPVWFVSEVEERTVFVSDRNPLHSMTFMLTCFLSSRSGAHHPDSAAAGAHQPAGHHSGSSYCTFYGRLRTLPLVCLCELHEIKRCVWSSLTHPGTFTPLGNNQSTCGSVTSS